MLLPALRDSDPLAERQFNLKLPLVLLESIPINLDSMQASKLADKHQLVVLVPSKESIALQQSITGEPLHLQVISV